MRNRERFMDEDKYKNQRMHERHPVNKEIECKLVSSKGLDIPIDLRDFSAQGLGIYSESKILPETNFIFIYKDEKIPIVLVWGIENNDHQTLNRYGFKLLDPTFNLERILLRDLM